MLSDDDIEHMRVVGRLARLTMDTVAQAVVPGIPTDELDRIVHEVRMMIVMKTALVDCY